MIDRRGARRGMGGAGGLPMGRVGGGLGLVGVLIAVALQLLGGGDACDAFAPESL